MHAQNFSHPRSEQADFRAALKRASRPRDSGPRGQAEKVSAESRFEEYDPYHNRNISSIISKITDDGPANLHQISKKTLKKNVSRRAAVDSLKLPEDTYTPSAPPQAGRAKPAPQSFTFNESEFGEEIRESGQARHSIIYQFALLLLIAVVAVIGFLLYQLTLKADEFSQALHLNEKQLVLTQDSQDLPQEMLPRLNSLGETLADLKAEIHGIKIGQQKANRKQAPDMTARMLQNAIPVPINADELGVLKNDLKQISTSLHSNAPGTAAVQAHDPIDKPLNSMDQVMTVRQEAIPDKLVVNLVSLTNRDKAHAAYDQLLQAGVSPLIEEATVNGKKIYRLSVDGFDTRESAQLFITRVSEKYGFEGGWIRRH